MEEATDVENEQNGKSNWKSSLCLFCFLLFYLIVGAFMFRAAEGANTLVVIEEVQRRYNQLLAKHPCVTNESIHDFYHNVTYYLGRGATLNRNRRLDREEEGELRSVWGVEGSLSFAFHVVTTIGYGKIVPRTNTGKLVCMVYAIFGIPLMAITLSYFGKSCRGFTKKYWRALNLLGKLVKQKRALLILQSIISVSLLTIIGVLLPSALIAYLDNWWYFDAIYFYIITILTIGFGDLVVSECSKCGHSEFFFFMIFVFSVIMGMCVISLVFSGISNYQREKTMSMMKYNSPGSVISFTGLRRRRGDGTVNIIVTGM